MRKSSSEKWLFTRELVWILLQQTFSREILQGSFRRELFPRGNFTSRNYFPGEILVQGTNRENFRVNVFPRGILLQGLFYGENFPGKYFQGTFLRELFIGSFFGGPFSGDFFGRKVFQKELIRKFKWFYVIYTNLDKPNLIFFLN
jgi:hypothetical protein